MGDLLRELDNDRPPNPPHRTSGGEGKDNPRTTTDGSPVSRIVEGDGGKNSPPESSSSSSGDESCSDDDCDGEEGGGGRSVPGDGEWVGSGPSSSRGGGEWTSSDGGGPGPVESTNRLLKSGKDLWMEVYYFAALVPMQKSGKLTRFVLSYT